MKVVVLIVVISHILFFSSAEAFSVIADLSPSRIEIHSKFTGKNILIFGALMEKTDNIVIIIHGPETSMAIHKKVKVLGLWTNGAKVLVNRVPYFFSFSSATMPYRKIKQIFYEEFIPFSHERDLSNDEREMVEALIQNKIRSSLYQFENAVEIINDRLFRGNIFLPGNIVRGKYTVEIIALDDNRIVGIESIPLVVVKTGLDAWIFDMNHSHPILYGFAAIIGAIFIGWLGFFATNRKKFFNKSGS
ncbi:transmembrane family protein [Neorickettsia helminthoeca str. Oregon]|uniref:Transmembrane family protein n=1 Tax=Neorickettsia helminthoeca str. Oregon TaxID=1286528 RepID=X5H3P7_9RICK|nr:TIGR02186 family protein [Neorickettsia helminthoeca]AHX11186.1 transmembrane family protein [Neorickettsia helminthoeca str. Oregon]